jgi:hypothetical protein
MIGKKGEGTFSEVLKCVDVRDGTYWACKKLKQYFKKLNFIFVSGSWRGAFFKTNCRSLITSGQRMEYVFINLMSCGVR